MRSSHTLIRGAALAGALTLWSARAAFAAAGSGERTPLNLSSSPTVAHHAASGGSGILRTVLALVVVIGLIYAIARILKAIKGRELRPSGDGLTQLATLPLGPARSLTLVRSGADIVLLGVAESGVTPIKTYTEEEAIANGLVVPDADAEPAAVPTFQSFLDGVRRKTVRS